MIGDHVSSENTTFRFLRGSPDFLHALLDNSSACILLLDSNMRLQAFNDAFRTIFSNKPDEHLLYKRCGEAIGCANHVEEGKDCGETSKCCDCELRKAALMAYAENLTIFKKRISREFYRVDDRKELRHLQFSVRSIRFQSTRYVFLLIEDVSHLVELSAETSKQKDLIEKLQRELGKREI